MLFLGIYKVGQKIQYKYKISLSKFRPNDRKNFYSLAKRKYHRISKCKNVTISATNLVTTLFIIYYQLAPVFAKSLEI